MCFGAASSFMSSSAKLTKEKATWSTSTDKRVTTITIITVKTATPRISMKRNHGHQIVEKEINWQGINFSFRDLWEIHKKNLCLIDCRYTPKNSAFSNICSTQLIPYIQCSSVVEIFFIQKTCIPSSLFLLDIYHTIFKCLGHQLHNFYTQTS